MKKLLSVCFSILFLFSLCVPAAYAAGAAVTVECAMTFMIDHAGYSYLRFGKDVVGVTEDFTVETAYFQMFADTSGEYSYVEPLSLLPAENFEVIAGEYLQITILSPYPWTWTAENGAEIWPYNNTPTQYVFHGLQMADGTTSDCTMTDDDFTSGGTLWNVFKQDALSGEDLEDGYFAAVGSAWKIDFSGHRGMEDKYLRSHVSLTSTGVTLEKKGKQYVFTSEGEGTVTLEVCGQIRRTWRVHVYPKKEIKQILLQELKANEFVRYALAVGNTLSRIGGLFAPLLWAVTMPAGFVYTAVLVLRVLLA